MGVTSSSIEHGTQEGRQELEDPLKGPPKKKEGGGGKAKKKKWSKGKVRDKLNNLVLFDQSTYDNLYKEVPAYKLITPAVVSERLKIRGSLARKALNELQQKGLIKQVVKHSAPSTRGPPKEMMPLQHNCIVR